MTHPRGWLTFDEIVELPLKEQQDYVGWLHETVCHGESEEAVRASELILEIAHSPLPDVEIDVDLEDGAEGAKELC